MRIFEWLKWLLWESWHGESVSAFDVRRTTQSDSPEVQVGSPRIPRWLIWVLVVSIVVASTVLALRLFGVVITTTQEPATRQSGVFESVSACVVRERGSGRTYVAVDCFMRACADWLWTQVTAVLVFIVAFAIGFAVGWKSRGKNKEG